MIPDTDFPTVTVTGVEGAEPVPKPAPALVGAVEPRPRRPRGRPVTPPDAVARRRQQIVKAAYEVFGERGYHAAGIADIAERLGIGHGTFYRYFENKRDILDHVIDYGVGEILKSVVLEGAHEATTLDEFRIQLEDMAGRLFTEISVRQPRLTQLVLFEATSIDDRLSARVFQLVDAVTGIVRSLLDSGVNRGFLRADLDQGSTALAATGALFAGMVAAARGVMDDQARGRYVTALVALLCEGGQATR